MNEFSQRLKAFRQMSGMTQLEMARKLGVTGNYIYQLESGARVPSEALRKHFEMLEWSAKGLRGQPAHERRLPESGESFTGRVREDRPVEYNPGPSRDRHRIYERVSQKDLANELVRIGHALETATGVERMNLLTVLRGIVMELESRI